MISPSQQEFIDKFVVSFNPQDHMFIRTLNIVYDPYISLEEAQEIANFLISKEISPPALHEFSMLIGIAATKILVPTLSRISNNEETNFSTKRISLLEDCVEKIEKRLFQVERCLEKVEGFFEQVEERFENYEKEYKNIMESNLEEFEIGLDFLQ